MCQPGRGDEQAAGKASPELVATPSELTLQWLCWLAGDDGPSGSRTVGELLRGGKATQDSVRREGPLASLRSPRSRAAACRPCPHRLNCSVADCDVAQTTGARACTSSRMQVDWRGGTGRVIVVAWSRSRDSTSCL